MLLFQNDVQFVPPLAPLPILENIKKNKPIKLRAQIVSPPVEKAVKAPDQVGQTNKCIKKENKI